MYSILAKMTVFKFQIISNIMQNKKLHQIYQDTYRVDFVLMADCTEVVHAPQHFPFLFLLELTLAGWFYIYRI